MQIVSKKHVQVDCGIVFYTEEVIPCADHDAVLDALRGYRTRSSTTPLDPSLILSLLDARRPQRTVVLLRADGEDDSVTLHTLH